ncbi:MAG TPA: hypothetical protein VEG68_10415 [Terriglobales bacterium]|nr:hypothetical protein [Terriglobales bacterium]
MSTVAPRAKILGFGFPVCSDVGVATQASSDTSAAQIEVREDYSGQVLFAGVAKAILAGLRVCDAKAASFLDHLLGDAETAEHREIGVREVHRAST